MIFIFLFHFKVVIAYIPVATNTAADYLSQMEFNRIESFQLTVREDMPAHMEMILLRVPEKVPLCLGPYDFQQQEQLPKFKNDMLCVKNSKFAH